jgi:hypothetical protein
MSRKRLDNRRPAFIAEIVAMGGQPLLASVGFDAEGKPAEVFLDVPKSSPMGELARDSALLISLALQHGVPIEAMRSGVGRNDETGEPHTIAGAALDLLSRLERGEE